MKKAIKFHKMEGAGNDFIVIDNRIYNFSLEEIINFTPELCDRKFGIGADGILVLNKPSLKECDYTMIYRNADGSDAGMCGNGSRCLALFASKNGFKSTHTFNVHQNIYEAEVYESEVKIQFPVEVSAVSLELDGEDYFQVNAATEHVIKFVKADFFKDENSLIKAGRTIRYHQRLNPPGTNVNFIHPQGKGVIGVQTYERGVEDLTLACGTGALASAVASHHFFKNPDLQSEYKVHMKGGVLKASFDYDPPNKIYKNLKLTGPANFVFQGTVSL